jgi:hypothetical protein
MFDTECQTCGSGLKDRDRKCALCGTENPRFEGGTEIPKPGIEKVEKKRSQWPKRKVGA